MSHPALSLDSADEAIPSDPAGGDSDAADAAGGIPAATYRHEAGPHFTPTSALALGPVVSPPHTVDGFVKQFLHELNYGQGVPLSTASITDQYLALARTVRAYLMARWLETSRRRRANPPQKMVGYLSAEYLLGRQLDNALSATELTEVATEAMAACGIDIDMLRAQEVEPGLGNGGLGRLAACFIDSLATLGVPSIGHGIRYEFGIFQQTFVGGRQVEVPDAWLTMGGPWEVAHPEMEVPVHFGGRTERFVGEDGRERVRWVPDWGVIGIRYNYMVPGYHNGVVNTLRLWRARATDAFDLQIFNAGDYAEAVRAQTFAENISKVLYPEDSTPQGRELRLQQQYFFVACSIKDFVTHTMPSDFDVRALPERIIFQLNDTHPVIAIPEMMRLLLDEHDLEWDDAWDITRQCFAYTCHTLLPEALEVWPVSLMERLLPRHMEIIYRINEDFVEHLREVYPGDELRVRRMSIIADHPERSVRMAHLATVGSVKVNGVAALHSQLLKDKVLRDFSELWPERFTNVTNGVTPRRFIRQANPRLTRLISDTIGKGWVANLDRLEELQAYAEDAEFRDKFRAVKRANKKRIRKILAQRDGIQLPNGHLLDVMVKRLHEYKRQSLKLLHVVTLYDQIISGEVDPATITPRTVVFGVKAAPGYHMAKETIFLINSVASVVNADPRVAGRLYLAFPPNYNVTLAEKLIPAADLSEQISLAGKEASGTGNMKFALNGALTIGTDDGANVEIRQLVGDDNFFLFGMTEPEVAELQARGYHPGEYYESNPSLKRAIDLIASGHFTGGNRDLVSSVVGDLLYNDRFLALADYASYMEAQSRVEAAYADQDAWARMAILNVARSGFFSSDRSIRDYIDRIWHVKPAL